MLDGALHLAARVGVLDPHEELAALVPGVEPVEERGAHAPDVEGAGRARCHADADTHRLPMVEPCRSHSSRTSTATTPRSPQVVAELERLGIEQVVCLGDAVQGGDEPREVLDRLAALGWPVILGNADDFLLEVPTDSPEPITEAQLERRDWTLVAARAASPRADPLVRCRRSTSSSTAA